MSTSINMPVTDDEWKAKLTAEQYEVLRGKGTDAPFRGALLNNHETGDFNCAGCGSKVFDSGTKFESGSGWPSFYDAANNEAVKLVVDGSYGMERTEVVCATCSGHLGHLFNDAHDQPTGNRFCINSTSLDFKPKK